MTGKRTYMEYVRGIQKMQKEKIIIQELYMIASDYGRGTARVIPIRFIISDTHWFRLTELKYTLLLF
jgi:hypothetical protein